jgi:hypothetical protein
MFWHVDEGRQKTDKLFTTFIYRLRKLTTPTIIGKQFDSSVTGKRQLVNVTWIVKVLDFLSVRGGLAYDRVVADGSVEENSKTIVAPILARNLLRVELNVRSWSSSALALASGTPV